MKRRNILAAIPASILLTGLALPAGDAAAQNTKSIAGTWRMVTNISTDASGKKMEPFGDRPVGTMILTPDGRYSIVVSRPELPKIAAGNRDRGTAEENRAIVSGSIAHVGRYKVDEAKNAIVFDIENSTYANWNATTQVRPFTVEADQLVFIVPSASMGGTGEVTWKRVQ
jgi:hypothetical protein